MKKIAFIVVMLLFVAGVSFGGDITEMKPFPVPLTYPEERVTVMGYGTQSYIGTFVQTELAIENTGNTIDILEIKWVVSDKSTRMPVFQFEFTEIDVKNGVWIIKSLPYDSESFVNAIKDKEIESVISVDAERW